MPVEQSTSMTFGTSAIFSPFMGFCLCRTKWR